MYENQVKFTQVYRDRSMLERANEKSHLVNHHNVFQKQSNYFIKLSIYAFAIELPYRLAEYLRFYGGQALL